MPVAQVDGFASVLAKLCALAAPDRPGHNASICVETGLTGTLNWLSSCVALATQASDGAVVGIVLPAVSFCTPRREEKKVLLWTIGPPSENPYWLLRIGRLSDPGTATGEF